MITTKIHDADFEELELISGKLLSCYEDDFLIQLSLDKHFRILHKLEYYNCIRTGGHVIAISFQMSKKHVSKFRDKFQSWFVETVSIKSDYIEEHFIIK